jgi:hypothetical protein
MKALTTGIILGAVLCTTLAVASLHAGSDDIPTLRTALCVHCGRR